MNFRSLGRIVVLSLLVITPPLVTAAPTIDDFIAPNSAEYFAVSPSGNRVAYVAQTANGQQLLATDLLEGVFLAGAGIDGLNVKHLRFVDEDNLVLRVGKIDGINGYGRLESSSAIRFRISDSSSEQLLTVGRSDLVAQLGLGEIVGYSDDLTTVYMPAFRSSDSRRSAPARYDLLAVNLDSGRAALHARGLKNAKDFWLNAEGQAFVQEVRTDASNRHEIHVRRDSEWVMIHRQRTELTTYKFVGLTPDYQSLVCLYRAENSGQVKACRLDLSDGTFSEFEMQDGGSIERLIVTANRVVIGAEFQGYRPEYQFFNEQLATQMSGLQQRLAGKSVTLASFNDDFSKLVVYVQGDGLSGHYLLVSEDGELSLLGRTRPSIEPQDMAQVMEVSAKARDGLEIPFLITVMPATGFDAVPAVVLPHGGPASYDRVGFDPWAQTLASQGYLVIQPQFRGSDGFGNEFLKAGYGQWADAMQTDVIDVLELMIREGVVDPERTCIVGASYGGYTALMNAAMRPDLYQCVVSINGVTDLAELYQHDRERFGDEHDVVTYMRTRMFGGDVDGDLLFSQSPVARVDELSMPVLLVHASDDARVPLAQSEDLYDDLVGAGQNAEFMVLEDEIHQIAKSENLLKMFQRIVEFVGEHTNSEQ